MRGRRHAVEQPFEHVEGGGVRPVQVFDDEKERQLRRQAL
jgi:hypothetical protein